MPASSFRSRNDFAVRRNPAAVATRSSAAETASLLRPAKSAARRRIGGLIGRRPVECGYEATQPQSRRSPVFLRCECRAAAAGLRLLHLQPAVRYRSGDCSRRERPRWRRSRSRTRDSGAAVGAISPQRPSDPPLPSPVPAPGSRACGNAEPFARERRRRTDDPDCRPLSMAAGCRRSEAPGGRAGAEARAAGAPRQSALPPAGTQIPADDRTAALQAARRRVLVRAVRSTVGAPLPASATTCTRCRRRIRPCPCRPMSGSPT